MCMFPSVKGSGIPCENGKIAALLAILARNPGSRQPTRGDNYPDTGGAAPLIAAGFYKIPLYEFRLAASGSNHLTFGRILPQVDL